MAKHMWCHVVGSCPFQIFLLLLKGAIDCPDIPLNVSRSFLQNDGYVRKISEYITKKVADKLCQLYTKDRENYEK